MASFVLVPGAGGMAWQTIFRLDNGFRLCLLLAPGNRLGSAALEELFAVLVRDDHQTRAAKLATFL
jgi:hypothetical protein